MSYYNVNAFRRIIQSARTYSSYKNKSQLPVKTTYLDKFQFNNDINQYKNYRKVLIHEHNKRMVKEYNKRERQNNKVRIRLKIKDQQDINDWETKKAYDFAWKN